MRMNKRGVKVKINNKGASLLEVLVATAILAVGFLGVIALSTFLFKTNAQATNRSVASEIAEMQMSQLNCLGASAAATNFGIPSSSYSLTYTYTVHPSIVSSVASCPGVNTNRRSCVTSCINPVLTQGGPAPSGLPPGGLDITIPYTVSVAFAPYVAGNPSPLKATVTVSWNGGQGQQVVTLYSVII